MRSSRLLSVSTWHDATRKARDGGVAPLTDATVALAFRLAALSSRESTIETYIARPSPPPKNPSWRISLLKSTFLLSGPLDRERRSN
jgi:hypothetical protein